MRPSEIEKAKLTATYANGVAISLAALGGIAPWVTLLVHAAPVSHGRLALSSIVCLLGSGGLHLLARGVLNRLDRS